MTCLESGRQNDPRLLKLGRRIIDKSHWGMQLSHAQRDEKNGRTIPRNARLAMKIVKKSLSLKVSGVYVYHAKSDILWLDRSASSICHLQRFFTNHPKHPFNKLFTMFFCPPSLVDPFKNEDENVVDVVGNTFLVLPRVPIWQPTSRQFSTRMDTLTRRL